jgi:hypothetical protein
MLQTRLTYNPVMKKSNIHLKAIVTSSDLLLDKNDRLETQEDDVLRIESPN